MSSNADDKFRKAIVSKNSSDLWYFIEITCSRQQLYSDEYIVNQMIENKWSLQKVVELRKYNLTKLFLESDNTINIDDVGQYGWTALHRAAYEVDVDNVEVLLEHNVNPNILDENLRTPLYCSYDNIDEDVDFDHWEILEIMKMLVDGGAKAVTTVDNINILQIENTLTYGNLETVEFVLKLDIDLRAHYGTTGNTVLHYLVKNMRPGVMKKIQGRDFDVDARNNIGETPLHLAAQDGIVEAVEFLLSEGANVNAVDNGNRTPLWKATHEYQCYDEIDRNMECVLLLLQHGADTQLSAAANNFVAAECSAIFEFDHRKDTSLMFRIMLEHLALQQAYGAQINDLIRSKIDSNEQLKKYFDFCKDQLIKKVYGSKTLLDMLCCNDEKLISLMRNVGLVQVIKDFSGVLKLQTVSFGDWLQKRLDKATRTATLRGSAATVICKLMHLDYGSYYSVVDTILRCLKDEDLNVLLSISF